MPKTAGRTIVAHGGGWYRWADLHLTEPELLNLYALEGFLDRLVHSSGSAPGAQSRRMYTFAMAYAFDPELQPFVDLIPAPEVGDVEASRTFVEQIVRASLDSADVSGLRIEDRMVPGPVQAPEVRVRVYAPCAASAPTGGVVYIHGGGFAVGSVDMEHAEAAHLARELGATLVSVEYRLAPEHPFPAALDDCYAALQWVHDHAGELGVLPSRIGIGGSSAGGNLAAGLALLARDRGELEIALQALIYPMLDDRMITTSSGWEVPIWPPASNDFGWSAYLSGRRGADDVPIHAAPARAEDLSGLPPTFICVGALDGFLDEDVDYANRLLRAGVPTELHVYPGAPHGFDLLMPDSEVATRCRRHQDEWLAARLGGP